MDTLCHTPLFTGVVELNGLLDVNQLAHKLMNKVGSQDSEESVGSFCVRQTLNG
jgi:hypothetical protein